MSADVVCPYHHRILSPSVICIHKRVKSVIYFMAYVTSTQLNMTLKNGGELFWLVMGLFSASCPLFELVPVNQISKLTDSYV